MDVWASKLFSIYSLTNLNTMVKQNPKSKYECLHCPKNHCKCCCKPFVAEEEKWDKEKADKDLENIKHRRQHIHSSSFPSPKEDWETDFKTWYNSIYPATWKAHVVIDRINDLLSKSLLSQREEIVKMMKDKLNWAILGTTTRIELIKEVEKLLTQSNKHMNEQLLKQVVFEALGEVSAVFMSKEERGVDIVMPTDELERIGNELIEKLNQINH